METENIYRQELIKKYRQAVGNIFRYLPWLEEKSGNNMVRHYQGNNVPKHSIAIPVYDSTLLGFVKDMNATGLMDRNYVYTFSRNRIRTEQDELRIIDRAELKNIDVVFDIMAKYVLGGMTKGILWPKGVENGVFYYGLKKIKEILEIWDSPRA